MTNESFDSIVAIHVKTNPAQNANKAHIHIIIVSHQGKSVGAIGGVKAGPLVTTKF